MDGKGKEKKKATHMVKDWNVIVESLKTYRETTDKNHYISKDYVIPSIQTFPVHLHGIKLGYLLNKARQAFRQKKLTPFQIGTLDQHQIHWEYETYKLKFVSLPALDMYKRIHGDLRVTVKPAFVIPSGKPWPEHMWGMKLGRQVKYWRTFKDTLSSHVVEALNDKDFVWDVYEEDFRTITVPALKRYGELHGNLLVPQLFQVPTSAQWPKSTHGSQLGVTVKCLRRHKGIDSAKDDMLDAMDFIWNPIRYQFETRMLPACKIYVQQKGDLNNVPISFKVPATPNLYPIACHGYNLGVCLHAWRIKGARPFFLEEIKALGFKPYPVFFSPRDLTSLLIGLKWFQTTFGYKERMKTSRATTTCLPDDHPTLPRLPLGEFFSRAKKWDEKIGFSEADRKELKAFASWNSVYQSTIYPLLEMYYLLHGNLHITFSFSVPSCSPWPTWSWQQKLGRQKNKICTGDFSLSEEEKDVLESMDFKWGPKGRTPPSESKRHKAK